VTSLIVAKRYARALLAIGREDGKFEDYGRELQEFSFLLVQDPKLESALVNPAFALEDRKNLLSALLVKMKLSSIVNNFFRLLMDRGRISVARDIALVYGALLDDVKGVTRAEIFSATALHDADVEKLTSILKKVVGREVSLQIKEDPSLIGGVVARIGDLVLDGSVKTQLAGITVSLQRGDYV
jgi:F-type H+-transporting ATPase subunit delta